MFLNSANSVLCFLLYLISEKGDSHLAESTIEPLVNCVLIPRIVSFKKNERCF